MRSIGHDSKQIAQLRSVAENAAVARIRAWTVFLINLACAM
jgi:hypothetical protein